MRSSYIGRQFTRLTVLELVSKNGSNYRFNCICSCGNKVEVLGANLCGGTVKSCGCLNKENLAAMHITHGQTKERTITPEYRCWSRMKERVLDPKNKSYKDYGGRGITIFPAWENDFQEFYNYITSTIGLRPSPSHSIDRIDNEGNYEPGNLKWSTKKEQNENTRRNRKVMLDGVEVKVVDLEKEYGIPAKIIRQRIDRDGWTVEKAVTTPLRGRP